jgi:hypothetical protein
MQSSFKSRHFVGPCNFESPDPFIWLKLNTQQKLSASTRFLDCGLMGVVFKKKKIYRNCLYAISNLFFYTALVLALPKPE